MAEIFIPSFESIKKGITPLEKGIESFGRRTIETGKKILGTTTEQIQPFLPTEMLAKRFPTSTLAQFPKALVETIFPKPRTKSEELFNMVLGTLGAEERGGEIAEQVIAKYGRDLGQQILKLGNKVAQSSLIKGGEDSIAHSLNIEPIKVTIGKLIASVKEAKPIRAEAEVLMSAERARRAAIGARQLEKIPGERGFFAAKGALKGELPKPQFEPPRERLEQKEIEQLFDFIKTKPTLTFFEKITTMTGLSKVLGEKSLGGKIPTENELKLLKDAFGSDFVKEILKKRPLGERFLKGLAEVINIPRALLTSIHFTGPFKQGLVLSTFKPKQAASAFVSMFKFLFKPELFNTAMESIKTSPLNNLMRESGLYIAEPSHQAVSLTSREEEFMSSLASKIPGIGKIVRGGERVYLGFLNKLRSEVFEDMAQEYISGGISPLKRPEVFKSLANFINTTTGRGELPGKLKTAQPFLNSIFFSPRLIASRLQMLNPKWYLSLDPIVRKDAIKSFLRFVGTGLSLLTIAKLGGALVEDDPRSSDFGKINIENTRYDIWGGFQQYIRLASQLITNKIKKISTGEIEKLGEDTSLTRLSQTGHFVESKLSPVAGFVVDLLRGQQIFGEDLDLSQETIKKLVPLYIQSLQEAIKEEGIWKGTLLSVPSLFGIQTQFPKHNDLPKLPELPQLPELPSLPAF